MNSQKVRILSVLITITSLLVFTGCATVTSHSDWDTSANFSALQTYSWVPGQQPLTGDARIDNNTLLDQRVRQAVNTVLTSKGYIKTDTNPDFWVSYSAAIEAKIDAVTMPSYGYATPYVGPYGEARYDYSGMWSGSTTSVMQYDEGSLILDVADAKTRRLIWRGTVSDVVDPSRSPEKKQQIIEQAISKAFSEFPPQ